MAYAEGVLDVERDLDADDGQTLLMLQDDPAALAEALDALYRKRQARGLNVPSSWEG